MPSRDLGDLLADVKHRIEAGAGILEDEADVAAGQGRVAEPRPVQPSAQARIVGQQPGQRQRQRALARAAFADDGEALAGEDVEIDGVERRRRPAIGAVGDRQAAQAGERAAHARDLRRASASARPSENR